VRDGFADRAEAGRRLAEALGGRLVAPPVVLALPRGGVPVAFEVATALDAPLEVFVARKVGAPGHPERGIGAVAEGGAQVADAAALRALRLSADDFEQLAAAERDELARRVRRYRGDRPLPELAGRDVLLVDDGLATGVTAEAALRALRGRRPGRLVLAAPAGAPPTAARLRSVADEVVCVIEPAGFLAVGQWYERFDQTTDAEVVDLLGRSAARTGPGGSPTGRDQAT